MIIKEHLLRNVMPQAETSCPNVAHIVQQVFFTGGR